MDRFILYPQSILLSLSLSHDIFMYPTSLFPRNIFHIICPSLWQSFTSDLFITINILSVKQHNEIFCFNEIDKHRVLSRSQPPLYKKSFRTYCNTISFKNLSETLQFSTDMNQIISLWRHTLLEFSKKSSKFNIDIDQMKTLML